MRVTRREGFSDCTGPGGGGGGGGGEGGGLYPVVMSRSLSSTPIGAFSSRMA